MFNQIAGFFDHQYPRKETVGALDFLYRDHYQRKNIEEYYLSGVPSHAYLCHSDTILENISELKIN